MSSCGGRNTLTGATEWKSFVDEDGDGIDDRWDPIHNDDWLEKVDPNTGDTYYYNKKTGVTQWKDFVDADGDGDVDGREDDSGENGMSDVVVASTPLRVSSARAS